MSRTIKKKWRKLPYSKDNGRRIKNAIDKIKADHTIKESESQEQSQVSPVEYAQNSLTTKAQTVSGLANKQGKQAAKRIIKHLKNRRTIKQRSHSTIKTVNSSIKTVDRSVSAVFKATKRTAQTVLKTTRATQKAARAAGRTSVITVKAAGRAFAATVKATITAVKGIVTVIAAGGWLAILIIVLICAIGIFFAFAFGEGNEEIQGFPSNFSISDYTPSPVATECK